MGYVGYDPCALGVLLGALDRALDERLLPDRCRRAQAVGRSIEPSPPTGGS